MRPEVWRTGARKKLPGGEPIRRLLHQLGSGGVGQDERQLAYVIGPDRFAAPCRPRQTGHQIAARCGWRPPSCGDRWLGRASRLQALLVRKTVASTRLRKL